MTREPEHEENHVSTTRRKPKQQTAPAGQAEDRRDEPGDAELLSTSPFEGDLDEELAAGPKGGGLSGLTLYLGAGLILLAGFVGGIQAHKLWGGNDSSASAGPMAGGARAQGGQGSQGGQGGQPGQGGGFARPGGGSAAGGAGNLTLGTVQKIDGKMIYLQTANSVVKVQTSGSTTVQVTKSGSLGDLKSGSTVVVRGTAGQDGTVTATSVDQGAGFAGGAGRRGYAGP
jgi:hypothetical protein